ncbi:RNA-binding domain-containing protein [Streptococcus catagoni]|uniref:RNA-binding domain-containing protein n=1 Tax=Streptococcus catagoni TaxID=2654874 RepID=UPI00140AB940|nr:RNA-binding domain-containing protein [Streptococcus catagoni]
MKLLPENKHLEYKAAKRSLPKDFWETYSSFANTEGGRVILGITDDLEVQGVSDPVKIQGELFTNLNNIQKVNKNLISDKNISIQEIDGKTIIEIFIPEASISQKPIYMNQNPKQSWIRDFETDRKATDEELKAMLRNSQEDLDSDLLDGFDILDLDENSLSEYKILLSQTDNRFQSMSNMDMLIEIGAFKRDRSVTGKIDYKLTIGGLLFFGKYNSITSAHGLQNFHLDYFNYINTTERWRDRVAPGEPGYANINIFSFYRTVLSKLIATIDSEFELDKNLKRTTYVRDIEVSLREALANSLIHADYFSENSVKIEAYNSYYNFYNPGKMKISVEEFINGGTPKPRNHTITNLFRKVGISERAGSGGPQIFATAQNNKLNFPNIELGQNSTSIQIWKVDIADAHPDLEEQEKAIIKLLTKEMVPQTSREIKDKLNLSKHYFDKSIKNLISRNFIEQTGQGKATRYSLKTGTREYLASLQQMFNILQSYHISR